MVSSLRAAGGELWRLMHPTGALACLAVAVSADCTAACVHRFPLKLLIVLGVAMAREEPPLVIASAFDQHAITQTVEAIAGRLFCGRLRLHRVLRDQLEQALGPFLRGYSRPF